VDWTKWYIFWADECVVSKNHEDSSFKHAKDVFLSKVSFSISKYLMFFAALLVLIKIGLEARDRTDLEESNIKLFFTNFHSFVAVS
jgi:6-phosphogluconolactonase/glucosamine-6-phosphate isomerase/deaminase